MEIKTWTVNVDGRKQSISVDVDPQSKRAMIRVNGRVAAKPMAGDDSERTVPVGSMQYIVRRGENDRFDLDVAPEAFLNRLTAEKEVPGEVKSSGGSNALPWAIGSIVIVIIVAGMIRFGKQGLEYMRVPWQQYNAGDGSFSAKFPALPNESSEEKNINGDIWTIKSLLSEYRNHAYAVQYIDMKTIVTEDNADSLMDNFFAGWANQLGGHTEMRERTSLGRNHAFRFSLTVPPQATLRIPARMRGLYVLRGNRLFIVWCLAAQADPFSKDLQEFLDAFKPGAAPDHPARLLPNVEASLAGERPAPPPPRAAEKSEAAIRAEELLQKQREEEIAARRAAEPQIYLEREWRMFHVDGCKDVKPSMQKVAIEQLPHGYAPHTCVPDSVRLWRQTTAPKAIAVP